MPIAHNAGYFWPKNSFLKYPGKITMKIGPLIDTQELSTDQINEVAKKWINKNVEKITL